jgi:hypothetical protein
VLGAGKAGIVIAWDESLRTRIWQTTVGQHLNDLGPLPRHTVEICPGFYGGVQSAMALGDGTVFVPVVDLCAHGSATGCQAIRTLNPVDGTGEFVALDARNGVVLWKRSLPQPVFGCATAASGVVFTATFDGHVYGFDAANGAMPWQARTSSGLNGSCPQREHAARRVGERDDRDAPSPRRACRLCTAVRARRLRAPDTGPPFAALVTGAVEGRAGRIAHRPLRPATVLSCLKARQHTTSRRNRGRGPDSQGKAREPVACSASQQS